MVVQWVGHLLCKRLIQLCSPASHMIPWVLPGMSPKHIAKSYPWELPEMSQGKKNMSYMFKDTFWWQLLGEMCRNINSQVCPLWKVYRLSKVMSAFAIQTTVTEQKWQYLKDILNRICGSAMLLRLSCPGSTSFPCNILFETRAGIYFSHHYILHEVTSHFGLAKEIQEHGVNHVCPSFTF